MQPQPVTAMESSINSVHAPLCTNTHPPHCPASPFPLSPPPPDITCENVKGIAKQENAAGEEEEVETVGFKLSFTFKENPYFTKTVRGGGGGVVCGVPWEAVLLGQVSLLP